VYEIKATAHAPLVRFISHRRSGGLDFVTYYLLCRRSSPDKTWVPDLWPL